MPDATRCARDLIVDRVDDPNKIQGCAKLHFGPDSLGFWNVAL